MQAVRESWYVTLEEVAELLHSRRGMRAEVEAWWRQQGVEVPEVLRQVGQYAIMARHVPTFRYEDAAFAVMAERAGLRPVWLGYVDDVFYGASPVKNSLVAPTFITRVGGKGGQVRQRVKLARLSSQEGRPLSQIVCRDNGSFEGLLPQFHLGLLKRMYPRYLTGDISPVNRALGGSASLYYTVFLSLALSHGVLFEDYHGGESGAGLGSFTNRVFEPSFHEVTELFGVRPLVVPLPWWPELALYPGEPLSGAISWRRHSFALRHLVSLPQNGNGSLALV